MYYYKINITLVMRFASITPPLMTAFHTHSTAINPIPLINKAEELKLIGIKKEISRYRGQKYKARSPTPAR